MVGFGIERGYVKALLAELGVSSQKDAVAVLMCFFMQRCSRTARP